ncbi:MAG: carbohydrate ABC transporter permease [Bacillota bacterium]
MKLRKKRLSRSAGGDFFIFLFLSAGAVFTAAPLVLIISGAFKPLDELFLFPPQFFVRNPTLQNFQDLFVLMGEAWIPMSRYLFNSILIVVFGLAGNVVFGSLAAYALSIHDFPGQDLFNEIIILSLMFARHVVEIPNYLTMSLLGWINTYYSIIVPVWGASLGLYLMKQFMNAMIDRSLVEAARIDGASELRIYWQIVMPIIKPAWLTLIILQFQRLWQLGGERFLYSEELKPLPYALRQIMAGGIARRGVSYAVMLIMMAIPIIVFIINQSKIVETMGTSGLD